MGGDLLVDRLGRAVRRQRRIGRHLRPVQRDHPQASQTGGPTQLKHLDEQHLHLLGVPSPEPRDHAVIRHVLADDMRKPTSRQHNRSIFRLERWPLA